MDQELELLKDISIYRGILTRLVHATRTPPTQAHQQTGHGSHRTIHPVFGAGSDTLHSSQRFQLPQSRLHKELADDLEDLHNRRGSRLNRIAPRGSAKTSWVTFAYLHPLCSPIWFLLEKRMSSSLQIPVHRANEYVEDIVNELRGNEIIKRDYGDCVKQYKNGRLILTNNCLLRSTSTLGKIRGRKWMGERVTLAVVDDPQNLQHVVSPLQRKRSMDWLRSDIVESGNPETNIICEATSLNRECMVCQLDAAEEYKGIWETKTYKSIISFPHRMDLWDKWKSILFDWDNPDQLKAARTYYDVNKNDMDDGSVVLWPERESLYDLMLRRATNGIAAFNSEKQSSPLDPNLCEWPAEYFDGAHLWFDEWPKIQWKKKVLGVDLSLGKRN